MQNKLSSPPANEAAQSDRPRHSTGVGQSVYMPRRTIKQSGNLPHIEQYILNGCAFPPGDALAGGVLNRMHGG